MRRTFDWAGIRAPMLALGFVAVTGQFAHASPVATATTIGTSTTNATPLLTYDSVGSWVEKSGITGDPNAISIVPVTGGSFLSPSSLSLGAFQTKSLGANQTVSFTNTPFHLKFNADALNGQTNPTPNQTPIDITGFLNGTLTGSNQSSVKATFNQPATGSYSFLTGLYSNTLSVPDNPLTIVPSTTNSGLTTIQGVLSNTAITQPVPEPSTILVFGSVVAAIALQRRLRRGVSRV